MPVTWTKVQVARTNPFDQTQETILEVNNVRVNSVPATEEYTFADGTSDPDIQAAVEADLTTKGYVIA